MKTRFINRAFALVLSVALLVCSVPAQDALGPNKLLAPPAPTLGGTTSLRRVFRGGRPMLGYVGRIGGVAFDGVAAPANGLTISQLDLSYSPATADGQRLSLSVNGQSVATNIYDWQLIPIAKFANSDDSSCVTLLGRLEKPEDERKYRWSSQYFPNYHPSFKDTLVGLRLFQLDDLIIDEWSWELPTEKGKYLLGTGESAPKPENKAARASFEEFRLRNAAKFRYYSYLISDRDKDIRFDTREAKLTLTGEPFYSFWDIDGNAYRRLNSGQSLFTAKINLTAELARAFPTESPTAQKNWLITYLQNGLVKYENDFDDQLIVEFLRYSELLNLLKLKPEARAENLNNQSIAFLKDRLAEVRTLQNMPIPRDLTELNGMVSNKTDMLRAINPAVWDTGVAVMRYAAFFRYVKKEHPDKWRSFMAQIERAPMPEPKVVTPTVY